MSCFSTYFAPGDGSVLELVRDGHVVKEIVRDNSYEYTKPPAHVLDEPVKVLPGQYNVFAILFYKPFRKKVF